MQFKRIRWASRLVVGVCLIGAGGLAMAQGAVNWPQRPIRIVIPHPPGGPSDLIARTVLERLHTTLKQPVILDNRAGAGGNIGAQEAAGTPGCWAPTPSSP